MRKSQYFPFRMFSAKQGHYWYHFYNVFGMTGGPWLWIEPGTSRTRCQHSTTRLSMRRQHSHIQRNRKHLHKHNIPSLSMMNNGGHVSYILWAYYEAFTHAWVFPKSSFHEFECQWWITRHHIFLHQIKWGKTASSNKRE